MTIYVIGETSTYYDGPKGGPLDPAMRKNKEKMDLDVDAKIAELNEYMRKEIELTFRLPITAPEGHTGTLCVKRLMTSICNLYYKQFDQ